MNLKSLFAIALALVLVQGYSFADGESRGDSHKEGKNTARPTPTPRAAAPRFLPHPPGAHPRGPTVRPHPIRVLSPKVVAYGNHEWKHWAHAEFSRPLYYWDWPLVRHVTCIAEDSYGDQYPVTEATFTGFGLPDMTIVEDDALDRCAAESAGDESCYLATCSHF